jgi:hypothetical protein
MRSKPAKSRPWGGRCQGPRAKHSPQRTSRILRSKEGPQHVNETLRLAPAADRRPLSLMRRGHFLAPGAEVPDSRIRPRRSLPNETNEIAMRSRCQHVREGVPLKVISSQRWVHKKKCVSVQECLYSWGREPPDHKRSEGLEGVTRQSMYPVPTRSQDLDRPETRLYPG